MRALLFSEVNVVSGGIVDLPDEDPLGNQDMELGLTGEDLLQFQAGGGIARGIGAGVAGNFAYDALVAVVRAIPRIASGMNNNVAAITALPPLPGRGEGQSGGSNRSSWSGNG